MREESSSLICLFISSKAERPIHQTTDALCQIRALTASNKQADNVCTHSSAASLSDECNQHSHIITQRIL